MRKSLKTECKQLSVALVSRIRLSNCFSISCVFDSILWEKSWRNRKSCEEKKRTTKMKTKAKAEHISQTSELLGFLQHFYDCLGKDDDELLFMWPIAELRKKKLWLTPESAAKDQSALLWRISSRVQGLSQIWASFSECSLLLGPFAIPSSNPLICNQITCCYWWN